MIGKLVGQIPTAAEVDGAPQGVVSGGVVSGMVTNDRGDMELVEVQDPHGGGSVEVRSDEEGEYENEDESEFIGGLDIAPF